MDAIVKRLLSAVNSSNFEHDALVYAGTFVTTWQGAGLHAAVAALVSLVPPGVSTAYRTVRGVVFGSKAGDDTVKQVSA